MIVAYFKDFGVLKETRREYWAIQLINFLDCTFYFALLIIAPLLLSEDLKLNDKQAGFSVMAFTSATSLMLFVSGLYTDWLGIRRSLTLSMVGMFILRALVVVVALNPTLPHRGILASVLLFLMAPFMAAIQTIFQSACQRFTTKRSRSAGFNLWYLFMNVGAAAAGFSVDIVRLKLHAQNAQVFSMGAVLALLCLIVGSTLIKREDQLVEPGSSDEPKKEVKVEHKRPLETFKAVIREPTLWRLLVLIALILGVRAVFTYLYLLMPKYWIRTIGPDAAVGTLNAINPIGIIIGLILFIPITNKFKVFNMLICGAMISSFSLFPMAVPWQFFSSDIGRAHYIMALLAMVIVTIGEVVWSPKLYEYTAAIAPKGQEGTYLGLSLLPWFLAKTLVSALSGYMLAYWSPEKVTLPGGETVPLQTAMIHNQISYWHSPAAMWLVLGLYAMGGCVIAVLIRGWLTRGAHWKSETSEQAKPIEPVAEGSEAASLPPARDAAS